MLRARTFYLTLPVLFVISIALVSPRKGESISTGPQAGSSADPLLRRLTDTTAQSISLNPSLSDDGLSIVFESTADVTGTGDSNSFHALALKYLQTLAPRSFRR